MTFYEDMLASSWELYYTSSVHGATKNIDLWLHYLQHQTKKVSGVKRDQLLSLLCRFYQLSSLAARDRYDLNRALADEKQAIDIAFELGNTELIASSLLRRTRIYLGKGNYQLAIQDAEAAIPSKEKFIKLRAKLMAALQEAARNYRKRVSATSTRLGVSCAKGI